MKERTLIFLLTALAGILLFAGHASAEDRVSCKAVVFYQDATYHVRESAKTMDKVKKDLVDEACDKVCDALHGDEEDACEKECKLKAKLTDINCTGKESKDVKKKSDKKTPEKKYYCKADVSCDGIMFSVKEHAKSKDKAEKKLIEEACECLCIRFSGKEEDECEKSCEKGAKIQNISCKEKVK